MSGPERSCIACGEKGERDSFIRLVTDPDGNIAVDVKHKLPGRGAYVCAKEDCLKTTVKKNLLARSYKRQMPKTELTVLVEKISDAYTRYLFSLMRAANGARKLSGGSASVGDSASKERTELILIARDAGNDITDKATELAQSCGVEVLQILADKREIAETMGWPIRSIFSINDTGLASSMLAAGRLAITVKSWL